MQGGYEEISRLTPLLIVFSILQSNFVHVDRTLIYQYFNLRGMMKNQSCFHRQLDFITGANVEN